MNSIESIKVHLLSAAALARSAALTTLMIMFGLQFMRVLFPTFVFYLRDARGNEAINLAPIALLIFGLSFLAGPLARYAGLRTALLITAGGTLLMRLAEQISFAPGLDLYLAGAGVALSLMYLPLALSTLTKPGAGSSHAFGLAILLGVSADNALHSALTTYDLSWQKGLIPLLIVVVLAAAAALALREKLTTLSPDMPREGGWWQMMALIGLGVWLFLQLVVFQNVARMGVLSGWSMPVAGLVVAGGNLLALLVGAQLLRFDLIVPSLVSGVLLVGTLLLPEETGYLGAFLSIAGQLLAAILILTIFASLGRGVRENGVKRTVVANGIGAILLTLLTFAYYIVYDIDLGFKATAVLPAAGVILALAGIGAGWQKRPTGPRRRPATNLAPAILGLLLMLLPLGRLLTWQKSEVIVPEPTNNTLRIMNYNLHNGFNTDGRLDLEALAQVIEESGAEVVTLQEVSRGWVINGSVDMLEWLSQRLGMSYVGGPTTGPQWGNATLSRYPLESVGGGLFPPEDIPLRRGFIRIDINLGAVPVSIYNTHLHHIREEGDIRQQQVDVLLRVWAGQRRSIITGDFNATPDAPELARLPVEGMINAAAIVGPQPPYTSPAINPSRQIDYIWLSFDLLPTEFDIIQTTASDHFPMVTTITVP